MTKRALASLTLGTLLAAAVMTGCASKDTDHAGKCGSKTEKAEKCGSDKKASKCGGEKCGSK